MSDSEQLRVLAAHDLQAALRAARQARRDAELAGCEMEDLAAVLHRKPPVGRWPQLTRASFGPSVAVLSG
jgi:hypothetical protein